MAGPEALPPAKSGHAAAGIVFNAHRHVPRWLGESSLSLFLGFLICTDSLIQSKTHL